MKRKRNENCQSIQREMNKYKVEEADNSNSPACAVGVFYENKDRR